MKTCFLHVGFHKTATTTFQQICGNNRDVLKKAGIFYQQFNYPTEKENRCNHSGPLSMIYKRDYASKLKKNYSQIDQGELLTSNIECQIKALQQENDLLYSGEALCAWPQDYYRRFLEELETFGFKVKVLALVRPPYSYACSAIQENIKSGKFNPLIGLDQPHRKRAITKLLPSRSREIETLQKVFGEDINFQPFSRALAHHDGPAAFCLEQLGIPVSWQSIRQDSNFRRNESLNNQQVRAMNLINKEFHAQQSRKRCSKNNFKILRKGLDQLKGGRFLLTESEFQLIKSQYKQLKQEINDLLGASFAEESLTFSDPISNHRDIIQSMARCAALVATQKIPKK